jgi:hypothetical protein
MAEPRRDVSTDGIFDITRILIRDVEGKEDRLWLIFVGTVRNVTESSIVVYAAALMNNDSKIAASSHIEFIDGDLSDVRPGSEADFALFFCIDRAAIPAEALATKSKGEILLDDGCLLGFRWYQKDVPGPEPIKVPRTTFVFFTPKGSM